MIEETSFVDMIPTYDVGTTGRDVSKTLKGDTRHFTKCYECQKVFNNYWASAPRWAFQEHIKGKKRYFCSWTCLSRNRKKRGKTNV